MLLQPLRDREGRRLCGWDARRRARALRILRGEKESLPSGPRGRSKQAAARPGRGLHYLGRARGARALPSAEPRAGRSPASAAAPGDASAHTQIRPAASFTG